MNNGIDLAQMHWWLIIGTGVLIGALALVIGKRALHKQEEEEELPREESTAADPFMHGSRAEKRRTFRRKGKCVEVEITDVEVKEKPWHGWVMDRSIKGLRLGVDSELAVGTLLNVRVNNLTPPMPWHEVKVVHCKPNNQGYELGCEFITPPTWNILLMFG